MRKTKAKITIILSIILMMVLSTISYGANYTGGESFTAALKTTSTSITKGSIVEVIIELKDFVDIGSGVNVFRAKLDYNENILSITEPNQEDLTTPDIVGINSWGTVLYNPDTSLLVVEKGGMVKTNEDIIKISFKVNNNASIGATAEVSLTEVDAGGIDDFIGLGSTLTLNVIETPAQEPDDGEENPDDGDEICSHEYELKHNDTQHYQVCKKCNEEKTGSKENHIYTTYTDNKDGKHTSTCTVCSYKLTEAHNFVNNKCTVCNTVKQEPEQNPGDDSGDDEKTCEHSYTYTDNKDGTHTIKCTKCEHEDKESHSTTEKCSKCGYTPVTNNQGGNNNNNNGGNTNGGTNNKDNTTTDKDYSKAGLNTVLIVVVGCVIVAAVVLYTKNKKLQDIK